MSGTAATAAKTKHSLLSLGGKVKEEHIFLLINAGLLMNWAIDELGKTIDVATRDPSWYGINDIELDKRRRWTSNARAQVGSMKKAVVAGKQSNGTSTSNMSGTWRELLRWPNFDQSERSNAYNAQHNDDFIHSIRI